MMNDKQLVGILSGIFNETLGIDEFDLSISMDKIQKWDSLKHIQLISSIERAFGIEIQFEDTIEMISGQSILNNIKKYIANV